ncbi:hypothetical protein EVA_13385 [gut metagenome]|uniref:Uncharacterized protein n=1 Tax=gut metagenome TaxID=749906 RepID=J9G9Q0_9ZZZZ
MAGITQIEQVEDYASQAETLIQSTDIAREPAYGLGGQLPATDQA